MHAPNEKITINDESAPVEGEPSPPVEPRSSPPHATSFRGRVRAFCLVSFVAWLVAVAATWCGVGVAFLQPNEQLVLRGLSAVTVRADAEAGARPTRARPARKLSADARAYRRRG